MCTSIAALCFADNGALDSDKRRPEGMHHSASSRRRRRRSGSAVVTPHMSWNQLKAPVKESAAKPITSMTLWPPDDSRLATSSVVAE
jgi:hypothetical protein